MRDIYIYIPVDLQVFFGGADGQIQSLRAKDGVVESMIAFSQWEIDQTWGYFSALSSANRRQSSGLCDTSLRATTRGLGQFVVSGKPHCLVSFGPRPFHVPPKT